MVKWQGKYKVPLLLPRVWAPVIKSASLRMFLLICAQWGWRICQMVIKSVHLNGSITHVSPGGLWRGGARTRSWSQKMDHTGLKQVRQEWYVTLHDFLILASDKHMLITLFLSSKEGTPSLSSCRWQTSHQKWHSLPDFMQNSRGTLFKSTDLGTVSWIFGMWIHHDLKAGTLFIEQSQYIQGILSCYGMAGLFSRHYPPDTIPARIALQSPHTLTSRPLDPSPMPDQISVLQ